MWYAPVDEIVVNCGKRLRVDRGPKLDQMTPIAKTIHICCVSDSISQSIGTHGVLARISGILPGSRSERRPVRMLIGGPASAVRK